MLETVPDLWPNEIKIGEDAPLSPVAILRQQATLLADKTNQAVTALVETSPETKLVALESSNDPLVNMMASFGGYNKTKLVKTGGLVHSLYLMTPTLEDYRYHLLSVSHGGEAYPVTVRNAGTEIECEDTKEFLVALRSIFASERTLRVIQTLLVQSIK